MRNINILAMALLIIFGYLGYQKYQENNINIEEFQNKQKTTKGPTKRKPSSTSQTEEKKETNQKTTSENLTKMVAQTQVSGKQLEDQTKSINEVSDKMDGLNLCYTHPSFCAYTQNVQDVKGDKMRLYGDLEILRKHYQYEMQSFSDKQLEEIKKIYGVDPYANFEMIQALMIVNFKMSNGLFSVKKDAEGNSKPYDKTYEHINIEELTEPKLCYTMPKNCDPKHPKRPVTEEDKNFVKSVLRKEFNDMLKRGLKNNE